MFQLQTHLKINNWSLLTILALSFLSLTIVNEVSSARSFPLGLNSFAKSLIQTRKRSGPSIEHWGTPVKAGLYDDFKKNE